MRQWPWCALACLSLLACGGSSGGTQGGDGGTASAACDGVTCSGHGTCTVSGGAAACTCDPGYVASGGTACAQASAPAVGGCQLLPADHLFNTPIDALPVHPNSAAFMTTIGRHNLHLDLGTSTDMTSGEYYGIPYNVVHGGAFAWVPVSQRTTASMVFTITVVRSSSIRTSLPK